MNKSKAISRRQLEGQIDNLLGDGHIYLRQLKQIRLKKAHLDIASKDYKSLSQQEAELERCLEDIRIELEALRSLAEKKPS